MMVCVGGLLKSAGTVAQNSSEEAGGGSGAKGVGCGYEGGHCLKFTLLSEKEETVVLGSSILSPYRFLTGLPKTSRTT